MMATLPACNTNVAPARSPRPSDVQVVAQWSLPTAKPAKGFPLDLLSVLGASEGCIPTDLAIDRRSDKLYSDSGNDVGGGKCNIYLYTSRPAETVARLAAMERDGILPVGMRVGLAHYTNAAHTEWTYTPAYPAELKRFDQ
jgi:hypothetical protein